MPLLTEQERLVNEELSLLDVAGAYTVPTTYGTVHDYGNIVTAKAGIVAFKFNLYTTQPNYKVRVSIGGNIVFSAAGTTASDPGIDYDFMLYLNAGTYNVLVEGNAGYSSSVYVRSFKCGFGLLRDLTGSTLTAYSAGITLNTPTRSTPIGSLTQTNLYIHVGAITAGAVTNLENVGEGLANGVDVFVDGVQVSYNKRQQDAYAGSVNNAAYGVAVASVTAGADHTVTITKDNAATTANLSVFACPWVMGSTSNQFPISNFTFSQNSTLYLVLEPYSGNATKFVGVGKTRLVSYGTATDYYGSTSGTGLITFSFTFQIVDVPTATVATDGVGSVISYIGVDVV
jgi:hypothetical protein